MPKQFLGASTGAAQGFKGIVQANYKEDNGFASNTKYIAILSNFKFSNEDCYDIYQLSTNTAVLSGFSVVINPNSGLAYVEHGHTDLPMELAERFVNLITGKKASFTEVTDDWFEFSIMDEDYR